MNVRLLLLTLIALFLFTLYLSLLLTRLYFFREKSLHIFSMNTRVVQLFVLFINTLRTVRVI